MKKILWVLPITLLLWCASAQADVNMIKVYKEAYPDAKPKCMLCHVDAIPKKEDGKHDLNAYGQAAKKLTPIPTADTFKQLGPAEDYKGK